MNRFYRVAITKRSVGTAIEHREPDLQGAIITKVTDATTAGDYKLIAVDSTDDEHKANLAQSGVQEISEDQAAELAPKYRPLGAFTQFNLETNKQERVSVPAADLKGFLQRRERGAARTVRQRERQGL